jgi:hypothetical protein
MDPARAARVRISFIETLKKFDPLDALVLKARYSEPGQLTPNPVQHIAGLCGRPAEEVQLSFENLTDLKSVVLIQPQGGPPVNFLPTNYGRALMRACTE